VTVCRVAAISTDPRALRIHALCGSPAARHMGCHQDRQSDAGGDAQAGDERSQSVGTRAIKCPGGHDEHRLVPARAALLMRFFPARQERGTRIGVMAPSSTRAIMAGRPWSISMLAPMGCHSSSTVGVFCVSAVTRSPRCATASRRLRSLKSGGQLQAPRCRGR
jgi:hypothetical protein